MNILEKNKKRINFPIDVILGDQNFLKTLFENTPISMIFYDKDGQIIFVNKFYSKVTGHSPKSKIGKRLIDPGDIGAYPTKDNWFEDKIRKAITERATFEVRSFYYKSRITGKEWYLDITIMPIICSHDNVLGAYSFARDVTDQIVNKQKVEQMNASLQKIVEQKVNRIKKNVKKIQFLLTEKNLFLRNIAHEFRTMLTVISSSIELIDQTNDKVIVDDLKQNIFLEIKSMDVLISDMIFISQSHKEDEIVSEKFNLITLVRKIISELAVLVQEKKIKLELISPSDQLFSEARMNQIESAIKNLVHNSIKYGKEGGFVKISLSQNDIQTVIEVSDNGRGISQNEQEKIFLPFYRIKKRNSAIKGYGLGLSICKKVVELHSGLISVSSKENEGTTFKITLPNSQRV